MEEEEEEEERKTDGSMMDIDIGRGAAAGRQSDRQALARPTR